jgi:large subunit ribosomal protein L15
MIHKRDKRSRLRGHRGGGYGARKKHRGKGSKGGRGMAGSGKKSGTKRVHLLKYCPNYLGAKGKGFTSIHEKREKLIAINIDEINKRLEDFKQKGLLKNNELNLEGYKVLGAGELKQKLTIRASKFSENAKEKIEASGSKAVSEEAEEKKD